MSSTVIKSYSVNYAAEKEKKEKRIIDSNQAVSDRIKELSELLEATPQEDFADEFTEGLDAAQVDALLADQDEVAAQEAQNEEINRLIEDANAQAQQIIEDANAQAQQIIDNANEQAKGIFEEANARGEAEGAGGGAEQPGVRTRPSGWALGGCSHDASFDDSLPNAEKQWKSTARCAIMEKRCF